MRTLFLFACIVAALSLAAQTDSSFKSSIAPTYTNVQTLTRADIERLPAFGFMQLVQGAFPFVGNESMVEEEYSFVVNGFVLTNPNAINVSQIESISFIPFGTNLTKGSFSKKGTFIINTKPDASGFSFSTHNGVMLPKDPTHFFPNEIVQKKNGFSSLNDLSYNHRSRNWFVTSAFSFLDWKGPQFQLKSYPSVGSLEVSSSSQDQRFRFSNFAGYEFNKQLKVDGGFFFTTKPGTVKTDATYSDGLTTQKIVSVTRPNVDYIGANASVTASISNRLSNRLSAELENYSGKNDFLSDRYWSSTDFVTTSSSRYHSTGYAFSDFLDWAGFSSSVFRLNFSLLSRYQSVKSETKIDSLSREITQTGAVPVSHSGGIFPNEIHGFLFSPQANFAYKNFLFAEAGISYDTYNTADFGINKNKKLLPNAGVRAELSSLLKKQDVSTLEVSGNYSKYLSSFKKFDQLGTSYPPNPNGAPFLSPFMFANPALVGYPPVTKWLISAAVGFKGDRFIFKVQYRNLERAIKARPAIPWYVGTNGTTYYPSVLVEKINEKGFCFELKASIIQKEKTNWNLYVTTFQDRYSRQYDQYPPIPDDMILFDAGKAPWRSGLRTSLNFSRLFVEASALVNFNELSTDKNGNIKADMDRYNNNFLVAGYSFPVKNKAIKNLRVSGEASGLFATQSFALSKYIGVGLQLNF